MADWLDDAERREEAERWVAEVNAAYLDGGYAAGDGPTAPLESMEWLLSERAKALTIIDAWHQFYGHLMRIVEHAPKMPVAEAFNLLAPEFDRIKAARSESPEGVQE